MDLYHRYFNLLSQYTNDVDLLELLWKNLDDNYCQNHRSYHNKIHLTELFNYFDKYRSYLKRPNILAFSIYYHDVIYNIWKKNNEEKSAEYAITNLLKLDLPSDTFDIVHDQIIATKTHQTNDNDTKWLVDFDLAILGKPPEVYKKYTQLIRKEYKLVPNFIYKKGRRKVLQHFIDKPFIYATEEFRKLYETQAKLNLSTELKSL